MSPVFRHGRLRLYLLKLLDEAPRHGYEVIRLLQDRFMGVYAPSPGTIYPRLARLEEDGLVTHEEVDGKKVYSITDKGREEIRARLGDLADLEDELTESLRDVAREISVDVRDTVRSIREELASAAREFRMQDHVKGAGVKGAGAKGSGAKGSGAKGSGAKGSGAKGAGVKGGQATAGEAQHEPGPDRSEDARRIREEAHRAREQMRADFRARNRSKADWAGWSAWSEWASGKDWAGKDWTPGKDWTRGKDWGAGAWGFGGDTAGDDSEHRADPKARRGGPNPFSDLEGLAISFANELRAAAKETGNIGERSLSDLRDILTDTLAKVRDEVFGNAGAKGRAAGAETDAASSQGPAADRDSEAPESDSPPGGAEDTK
ncbi:MAG TPA: PadR family transcriptional regulator [Streptosporangiaceae bacterium]|nr:PadR family transcriptional regulator [Streptosporangiaceae bacterium]